MKRISLGCDHAGFEYKEAIIEHLKSKGFYIEDFGTFTEEPVDYPEFIHAAAKAVADRVCDAGIILGGSGNEAIVANRIKNIRCAVVWNERTAQLSKEHGNCNMIGIGQRMMSVEQALSIVDIWLNSEFKGGRHLRRIEQIDPLN